VRYERVDLVEYGRALGVRVVEVSNVIEAFYYFTGFNLSSTPEWFMKPFTGSMKIQTYTLSLLDEARSLLNSAYTIASQLGYYGRSIRAAVSSINKSIDHYKGLVESYPTYTSYKSISVYVESMRYYWLARYLVSGDLNFIPAYINETLSDYVAILSDTSRCTLLASLKQALVYTAWLSYVKARESQDYSEVIDYALMSTRNLKLVDLLERAVVRDVELETSASKISELYSHALALSAYVERLLELIGRGSTPSSELSVRLEALNHAYTSNACMVIGATILVIESVTSSLHSALGDTSTLPSRLPSIVYRLSTIEISDIASLYHQAYIESSEVKDLETSISVLISLVAILQVSRTSAITSTSLQTPGPTTTSTPSRTTSTPSSSESGVKSPETTTSTTTQTGYPASWIELLMLLTIVILISLIIVLVLRKKL
jgi:predicted S18 family serine protease